MQLQDEIIDAANESKSYLDKITYRKKLFILFALVGIPGNIYFSYANKSGEIGAPLIDILMFTFMLVPALQTYLLASMIFSKSKSVMLAIVMFIPTIIFQLVILISLWSGINRAVSARKT